MVLLSYTVTGLQQQLTILRDTAKNLGLLVNVQISNVVVFRNGDAREKWFHDGMKLEIVNRYKYLGVIFFYRLTFSYAHEDVCNRAKKGVVGILKLLWTLGDQSPKLFFKLTAIIQHMLTYGSEVWGLIADKESLKEFIYLLSRDY